MTDLKVSCVNSKLFLIKNKLWLISLLQIIVEKELNYLDLKAEKYYVLMGEVIEPREQNLI